MVLIQFAVLILLAVLLMNVLSWALAFVMAPFVLIWKFLTREEEDAPTEAQCVGVKDERTFKQKMSDAFHGR